MCVSVCVRTTPAGMESCMACLEMSKPSLRTRSSLSSREMTLEVLRSKTFDLSALPDLRSFGHLAHIVFPIGNLRLEM